MSAKEQHILKQTWGYKLRVYFCMYDHIRPATTRHDRVETEPRTCLCIPANHIKFSLLICDAKCNRMVSTDLIIGLENRELYLKL